MIRIAHLGKEDIERSGKEEHPQYRYEREGIYHDRECPHHARLRDLQYGVAISDEGFADCHEHCRENWSEISYEGATLCTREENGYQDSDFYAVVWDEPSGSLKRIDYATTRFSTYGNGARADATDEVKAKAERWLADFLTDTLTVLDRRQSEEIAIGREVEVVKGRNYALGRRGWVGVLEGSRWGQRAKLDDGQEQFWIAAANVEVVESQRYRRSAHEIREIAERQASHQHWHAPFTRMPIVL